MTETWKKWMPDFAEKLRVDDSLEGGGLGLFAKAFFQAGDEIYVWKTGGDGTAGTTNVTLMEPSPVLSGRLSSEFAALAFQLLRVARLETDCPWLQWLNAGVSAPPDHPLKLLTSDPALAKHIWTSTTAGGRMSATALDLREDCEQLGDTADLEEWADTVATVMSRCVCKDDDGRELLVMGLDMVQDNDDPNVIVEAVYEETTEGGVLGVGAEVVQREFIGVRMKALRPIGEDEELTLQYVSVPHAGGYLERFGFVPFRLQDDQSERVLELVYEPIDEDEDMHIANKETVLEDLGLRSEPMSFFFYNTESIVLIQDSPVWTTKPELDRMTHILRFHSVGGADSFLADAVLIGELWNNCSMLVSQDNEAKCCQMVLQDCEKWLERFDAADAEMETVSSNQSIVAICASMRRMERAVLLKIQGVYEVQEAMVINDLSLVYWADRKIYGMFPGLRDSVQAPAAG